MKRILLTCLLLTGCNTPPKPDPEPLIITKEVLVPVVTPCLKETDVPAPKPYTDSDEALLNAHDFAERYRLMTIGRKERELRLGIIEPIVAICKQ